MCIVVGSSFDHVNQGLNWNFHHVRENNSTSRQMWIPRTSIWMTTIQWVRLEYKVNLWHENNALHDDVIKWKHLPRYWPFVWGIHRSPVNSPHKGQRRGAEMFSLICVWINGWVNNREAGDLRSYRAHYDVSVTSTWHIAMGLQNGVHFASASRC